VNYSIDGTYSNYPMLVKLCIFENCCFESNGFAWLIIFYEDQVVN